MKNMAIITQLHLLLIVCTPLWVSAQSKNQKDSLSFAGDYTQAINLYKSSKYEQSRKYWKKALRSDYAQDIPYYKAKCLVNIGVTYKLQGTYDSAFISYEKARTLVPRKIGIPAFVIPSFR